MLYLSTIKPATLDLLRQLIAIPELNNLYLVGGTNLSLRYGHRLSIDLDLASVVDFDNDEMIAILKRNFPDKIFRSSSNKVGIFGFIDEIKVDIVRHHNFIHIQEAINEEGIRMFNDKDIIAMKLFAILRRGQKKDLWDIAELLKKYSIAEMINFYEEKYPDNSILVTIPTAIIYFEDAENSPEPISLKGQTWVGIKKTLQVKVREFLS
jgi:predicted nucleotidyltransferase component of viral defense system